MPLERGVNRTTAGDREPASADSVFARLVADLQSAAARSRCE